MAKRAIFVPDVNFWEQLDEDVLKPCDREISEEGMKDKEQQDEGNEEEDEEIAKNSGDVDKDDGEEEDEDNLVEKEMEGTYVGTVARELQSNIEERNKTTASSDLSVYQYSVDSEKCDGHESDHDENGNNNVQVSASIYVLILINLSGSFRCIGGFNEVQFKGFGYY